MGMWVMSATVLLPTLSAMPSRMATRRLSTATVLPPTIGAEANLCAALDAFGNRCNARTEGTPRYCPHHNAVSGIQDDLSAVLTIGLCIQERIKLYVNYKIHHSSLDKFPEDSICHSAAEINGCTSLKTVRAWNKALVVKYRLLNRFDVWLSISPYTLTRHSAASVLVNILLSGSLGAWRSCSFPYSRMRRELTGTTWLGFLDDPQP
jgi:hypothetical protein